MTVQNIKKQFKIRVPSKHGKPIITKGFIALQDGNNHMGCSKISESVLYKDFEWEGK